MKCKARRIQSRKLEYTVEENSEQLPVRTAVYKMIRNSTCLSIFEPGVSRGYLPLTRPAMKPDVPVPAPGKGQKAITRAPDAANRAQPFIIMALNVLISVDQCGGGGGTGGIMGVQALSFFLWSSWNRAHRGGK